MSLAHESKEEAVEICKEALPEAKGAGRRSLNLKFYLPQRTCLRPIFLEFWTGSARRRSSNKCLNIFEQQQTLKSSDSCLNNFTVFFYLYGI